MPLRVDVPDLHDAVCAAGDQEATVGSDVHGLQVPRGAFECACGARLGHLEHPHGAVGPTVDGQPAIGGEDHRAHAAQLLIDLLQAAARLQVPDTQGVVIPDGSGKTAVRADAHLVDGVAVSL